MAMSDFLENAVLDSVLNAGTFPTFASVFVALYTTATTDAGGGTEVTTVGTGYVRQEVIADWTIVSGSPGHRAGNDSLIEYPVATLAYGASATHIGIRDAVTGGNLLFHGVLTTPQNILLNQIFQIPINILGVTVGATPA